MKLIQQTHSILSRAITQEGGVLKLCSKFMAILFKEGPIGITLRIKHLQVVHFQENLLHNTTESAEEAINYQTWLDLEEMIAKPDFIGLASKFKHKPLISIVCPTFNANPEDLSEAINSVLNQHYDNWELCLADDCSTNFDLDSFITKRYKDKRIKIIQRSKNGNISLNSNSAIAIATGEFICFLDQDDLLSDDALFWIAAAINNKPNAKFIYSDEDKLDESGLRCDPNFKPDWNYHYLLSCNYICHLAAYRKDLLDSLGGCRAGYEGAQDYDLVLRASEILQSNEIHHIPRILYHWRKHPDSTSQNPMAKPYALIAGERALQEHLKRSNIEAKVKTKFISYEVTFEAPSPSPSVSIIIPTRNQFELLKTCIDSLNIKILKSLLLIMIRTTQKPSATC